MNRNPRPRVLIVDVLFAARRAKGKERKAVSGPLARHLS